MGTANTVLNYGADVVDFIPGIPGVAGDLIRAGADALDGDTRAPSIDDPVDVEGTGIGTGAAINLGWSQTTYIPGVFGVHVQSGMTPMQGHPVVFGRILPIPMTAFAALIGVAFWKRKALLKTLKITTKKNKLYALIILALAIGWRMRQAGAFGGAASI